MHANVRRGSLAATIALALAGCISTQPPAALESDEAQYSALYPYYAEVCAVSQIQKKPGFGADIRGGPGGHAVLYLNGVCRVRDAGYPTVAVCDGDPQPGQGVGLSVNAHYSNANWVATEGRDFFLTGGLSPMTRLTRIAYRRAQEQAEAQGVLDGVTFHDGVFDDMPAGMSRRDWMYEMSIGTDYAIGFARDRYCARVPLDRARMARVVDFLNDLNAPYKAGRKVFDWNVLQNNCSHMIHNALSAADIWDMWEPERFVLFAAFDFPVPKNELVNLMRRTNDLPLNDPATLYADSAARAAVLADGILPTGPGALAEFRPVIQDNEVYDTDLSLIFYDEPILGRYERRFRSIYTEPRYFDLRANLRYFTDLYRQLQAQRTGYSSTPPFEPTPERQPLAQFYERFYQTIDKAQAAAESGLARLDGR
ncbi:MAG: hypothetical protein WDO24_18455 [Pseudomonadota bacterium]